MYNVSKRNVLVEWDDEKNRSNSMKHGISFEEAVTVFLDRLYLEMSDPDHSDDEERFVAIGYSDHNKLLVVCFSPKMDDTVIRIISARKATKNEARQYGEQTNAKRI
jgi:uncharacterized DUF497 family protein